MAVIDTTFGSLGLIGRIGELLATAKYDFIAWNDARLTSNALASLSNRELEDIGLVRGDIQTIAVRNSRS